MKKNDYRYRCFYLCILLFPLLALTACNSGNVDPSTGSKDRDMELLPSAPYHDHRNGLNNARYKFEVEKRGRVAFLGGSITYNPGWRDSVCAYLERRFPDTDFEFIAAGIPSMGTTPGAFRLERDVLAGGPVDLLFEEAAVNDRTNGRTEKEQIRGMEGIVRHVRDVNPATDIVIMYFVDPEKMADYRAGRVPGEILNHEKVAQHYAIPTVDLAREVTDRIDAGEFSWEDDFKDLHPSPFGQEVYYRSIKAFLEKAWEGGPPNSLRSYPIPEKIDPYCYDQGRLEDPRTADKQAGWEMMENWYPMDAAATREDYTRVPMLVGASPGQLIIFNFEGRAVGVAVAAGPDAGIIEYRIDGGPWRKQDLFTRWSAGLHLPWFYTLAADLSPGDHTLYLRLGAEKNPESTGTACRIRYFFVNE